MNHLHFVQSLETLQGGGLGAAALQLHEAMNREGSSRLVATRDAEFQREWKDCYQAIRSGPTALYFSKELRHLASTQVSGADWVHGHGLYVYPNYVFGNEARKQKRPMTYHVHGFFDPWILKRSKSKKRLVNLLFEKRNLDCVRFMRALTSKEADQIRAAGFKCPIEVIPNGIDLEEIDAEASSGADGEHFLRKRPKRLMFLSRLHPKKGLDLLIPVWAKLADEFRDWELVIVGPDEGGYKSGLDKLIGDCNVTESCTILPAVSGELKNQVFRAADMFVLPSYSEGFPMAVLEAMAHRIPTVVTTECNVPEFAEAGAVWQCLPEADQLEDTLRMALGADQLELEQRSAVGRSMLERSFTWTGVARRLNEACLTHQ